MMARRRKEDCKLQIGANQQFAFCILPWPRERPRRPRAICNSSPVNVTRRIAGRASRTTRTAHFGISLLEVVIALAIFLAATTVIGQLISTGSQAAIGAQLKAEAARRCETVMSEAIAGVVPLESTGDMAFEDDPYWTWSLTVSDAPVTDLVQIEARVTRQTRAGQPPATMSLIRWVRDPALWTQSTVESTSSGGTP